MYKTEALMRASVMRHKQAIVSSTVIGTEIFNRDFSILFYITQLRMSNKRPIVTVFNLL